MKEGAIVLPGYSRYYFDKDGTPYNDALDAKMSTQERSGVDYYRFTNDKGERKTFSVELVKEMFEAEYASRISKAKEILRKSYEAPVVIPKIQADAKPFLKWQEAKGIIIQGIQKLIPKSYNRYVEIGFAGGNIFFNQPLKKGALLMTYFESIAETYAALRDKPADVIRVYNSNMARNSQQFYFAIRDGIFKKDYQRAAQLIYMNQVYRCGCYRTDRKGNVNTSYGRHDMSKSVNENDLWTVHEALQGVEIIKGNAYSRIKDNDFVVVQMPEPHFDKYTNLLFEKSIFMGADGLFSKIFSMHLKHVRIMVVCSLEQRRLWVPISELRGFKQYVQKEGGGKMILTNYGV